VLPSNQCFGADDAARVEIEHGLMVQASARSRQRLTHQLEPQQRSRRPRLEARSYAEGLHLDIESGGPRAGGRTYGRRTAYMTDNGSIDPGVAVRGGAASR
jgi:hypothetical protein